MNRAALFDDVLRRCSSLNSSHCDRVPPGMNREERLRDAAPDLLEALKLFMDMWNSGDSTRSSKRAEQRRAEMWVKANAAIAKAEGK